MCKKLFVALTLSAILAMCSISAYGQGLKGRWGWGFGFGAQQQYSDQAKTPFGVGGEGLLTYRLTDKVSLSLAAGYNALGFKFLGVPKTFITNLFFGDFLVDYELGRFGKFRPFVKAGIGAFNFGGQNFQLTLNSSGRKRFYDGEGLIGAGFRYFLNPTSALTFSGSAKYTTADALDSGLNKSNRINDAYFTVRTGITFYLGPKTTAPEEKLFSEQPDGQMQGKEKASQGFANEESSGGEEQGEMGNFLSKLANLDKGKQSGPGGMDEYIRLRSKIDELNSAIEKKEHEISNLQQEISSKQGNINAIQQTRISSSSGTLISQQQPVNEAPINFADISSAYETALNKFYSRRYLEAIQIFQKILLNYPQHPLASNCQYWIGESYFADGDYASAVSAFQKVLAYARSLKKDDALFMLGRAYMQLGRKDLASDSFSQLVNQYPDSEYVGKAQKYLRKL